MDFVALCRGFMKERTESQFRDLEAPIKVSNESFAVTASPQLKWLIYVVVQFYPLFKSYFPLFWGMVMYDNEFKTMGNKN